MRHGHALYSGAWDNKPPLIFYTYAAIQAAFGTGVLPLHLVTTIVVLATQATVVAIGVALFGARRAIVAGAVFAFVLGTPVIEGNLAMTETYMILPTSLAVLAYVVGARRPAEARGRWYAASGVLIGIAAGYKQVAVFDGAAIAVMIWLTEERPLRALAPLVAGAAAPQAALAAVYIATGAFGAYWYAIAGSLGVYSEFGETRGPVVGFIGYLPAIVAVAWLVRRKREGAGVEPCAFPALWLGFALAGATSSTFAFPHYLQQAAPAAALAVVSMPWRWERDEAARLLLAVGAVLSVAVVFGQFAFAFEDRRQVNPVEYYRTFVSHRYGTMSDEDYDYYFDGKVLAVDDIVAAIHEDGRGTSVYTWSELPWIYAAGVDEPDAVLHVVPGRGDPGGEGGDPASAGPQPACVRRDVGRHVRAVRRAVDMAAGAVHARGAAQRLVGVPARRGVGAGALRRGSGGARAAASGRGREAAERPEAPGDGRIADGGDDGERPPALADDGADREGEQPDIARGEAEQAGGDVASAGDLEARA